jgi:hypothetical protein
MSLSSIKTDLPKPPARNRSGGLKIKVYAVALFNLALSLLYFKQVIDPGNEADLLDLKGILLTPFALLYTLLGIIISLLINRKKSRELTASSDGSKWSYVLLAFILVSFIAFPLTFLNAENGYQAASPLLLALLEPLKATFLYRESQKQVSFRTVILFFISFLLLFIASIFPPLHAITGTAWAAYFGGIYFLCLTFIDFWLANRAQDLSEGTVIYGKKTKKDFN